MFSSGPDAFRYVFSQRHRDEALDFLHAAFVQGDGEFGYRQHMLAEFDGRVVASGALWGPTEQALFGRTALAQIRGFYGLGASMPVIWRGLRVSRVLPPAATDEAYIAHVGVAEWCRRQGVGRLLMRFLIEQAGLRGFGSVSLDVATDNAPARALYDSLGFEAGQVRPASLTGRHGRVAEHGRMRLALPS
jgi:ribosomal protein S18 acetylase RimI-like enzyme